MTPEQLTPLWVFGYGSLVWRPDMPHVERRPARIRGWARRFWQGSTDHRGVPGAPGRVVTLVPERGSVCAGMAYRIGEHDRDRVLERLDHREKGGYVREVVSLWLDGETAVPGLVYRATPDNPNWLGPASAAAIAEQVRRSEGPSGPNEEYVLRLAAALRDLDAPDPHVLEIERQLMPGRQAGINPS